MPLSDSEVQLVAYLFTLCARPITVSRILGLASEPCRDLGLREPSYYQQSRLDLLLDADPGSGVTAMGLDHSTFCCVA